jgi:hypothetical protein
MREKEGRWVYLVSKEDAIYGGAAAARGGRVAGLHDEVLDHLL